MKRQIVSARVEREMMMEKCQRAGDEGAVDTPDRYPSEPRERSGESALRRQDAGGDRRHLEPEPARTPVVAAVHTHQAGDRLHRGITAGHVHSDADVGARTGARLTENLPDAFSANLQREIVR